MTFKVCLPFVLKEYADACLATCKFPVCTIDNTVNNLGIMKSHNIVAQQVLDEGVDWLIILSAAIRFGKPGGMDFIQHITEHPDFHVVEAGGVYGWHLIAFSRKVLEQVGLWDENFTPYGFDDLDYSQRIQLTFKNGLRWAKFWVDAEDMGMAHSLKKGGVQAPAGPRLKYFCDKWGVDLLPDGGKLPAKFIHPFNDSTKPLSWWPKEGEPLSIIGRPE